VKEEGATERPVATTPSARPECGDTVAIPLPDGRIVNHIPLAGILTNVPEYHDCQRLKAGTSPDYGSLVAIYARYKLDSVYRSREFANAPEPVPVAQIFSYDSGYAPLGIRKGFNCLALRRAGGRWTARLRAMGEAETDCLAVHATDTDTVLAVHEIPMPKAGDTDYPPVARWDWDEGNPSDPASGHQSIGIKCGTSWCEVGTDHPIPTPAAAGRPKFGPMPNRPAPTQLKRDRVSTIKGWYDEQRLAIVDGAGRPHPGSMLAQVYPHPQNDEVNSTAAFAIWRPSAVVMLPEDAHYDKLKLGPGQNTIFLCQGAACAGVPPEVKAKCVASDDGLVWYARIESQEAKKHTCVTRHQHNNVDIVATARWRWVATDEKVWIRCASGCCTVL
jgi:hypothetical protein